jgi:hypothetical protein
MSVIVFSLNAYSKDTTYLNKSNMVCDGTKVEIVTKCDDENMHGSYICVEQNITFIDIATKNKMTTSSYGNQYNNKYKGSGIANAWKCVKGKNKSYLSIWYSTGGNCDECEWQGILDLEGNRVATTINKSKLNQFYRKWKSLGIPMLGPYDFVEIPLGKND